MHSLPISLSHSLFFYINNEILSTHSDAKPYEMRFPIQSTARHCYIYLINILYTTGNSDEKHSNNVKP